MTNKRVIAKNTHEKIPAQSDTVTAFHNNTKLVQHSGSLSELIKL